MVNRTSWSTKSVTLGGTLTFEQMAYLEEILKESALDASTSGRVSDLEKITEISSVLDVDCANIGDTGALIDVHA